MTKVCNAIEPKNKLEMKVTPEHNERIAKMTFASVYPHYVTKIEEIDNQLTRQARYLDKHAPTMPRATL